MVKLFTTKLIVTVSIGVIAISAFTYAAFNTNSHDGSDGLLTKVNTLNIATAPVVQENQSVVNNADSKQENQSAVAATEPTVVTKTVSTGTVTIASQASQPNANDDKTVTVQADEPVPSVKSTSIAKQANQSAVITNASIKTNQPKAVETLVQVNSNTVVSVVTRPKTVTSAAAEEYQLAANDYTTTEVNPPKTVSFVTKVIVQQQTASTVSKAVEQTTTVASVPVTQQQASASTPVAQQQSSGSVASEVVATPTPTAVSTPAPVAELASEDSSDEEVCEDGCN